MRIGQNQILREHKLSTGWEKILHERATWPEKKKTQNVRKTSTNFTEWRKSEYFSFKRSFSNFESHKLSQIRPKLEKTTKLSAPERFWYFIHNYSRDKLLELLQYLNFALINFLWERQQNSVFLLYFKFFQNVSFCSSKKRANTNKNRSKILHSCVNTVRLFNIVVLLPEGFVQFLLKL